MVPFRFKNLLDRFELIEVEPLILGRELVELVEAVVSLAEVVARFAESPAREELLPPPGRVLEARDLAPAEGLEVRALCRGREHGVLAPDDVAGGRELEPVVVDRPPVRFPQLFGEERPGPVGLGRPVVDGPSRGLLVEVGLVDVLGERLAPLVADDGGHRRPQVAVGLEHLLGEASRLRAPRRVAAPPGREVPHRSGELRGVVHPDEEGRLPEAVCARRASRSQGQREALGIGRRMEEDGREGSVVRLGDAQIVDRELLRGIVGVELQRIAEPRLRVLERRGVAPPEPVLEPPGGVHEHRDLRRLVDAQRSEAQRLDEERLGVGIESEEHEVEPRSAHLASPDRDRKALEQHSRGRRGERERTEHGVRERGGPGRPGDRSRHRVARECLVPEDRIGHVDEDLRRLVRLPFQPGDALGDLDVHRVHLGGHDDAAGRGDARRREPLVRPRVGHDGQDILQAHRAVVDLGWIDVDGHDRAPLLALQQRATLVAETDDDLVIAPPLRPRPRQGRSDARPEEPNDGGERKEDPGPAREPEHRIEVGPRAAADQQAYPAKEVVVEPHARHVGRKRVLRDLPPADRPEDHGEERDRKNQPVQRPDCRQPRRTLSHCARG